MPVVAGPDTTEAYEGRRGIIPALLGEFPPVKEVLIVQRNTLLA